MWQQPVPFDEVPHGDHPGSFGFVRKHHVHEGVDLYCPEGNPVCAVEDGVVVAIERFTGEIANPPSPWWLDTDAVLVEGLTGVVVYGEITVAVELGARITAGEIIGHVARVIRNDKGRPLSMLHLELHQHGTRVTYEWITEKPPSLLDPTPYLAGRSSTDITTPRQ